MSLSCHVCKSKATGWHEMRKQPFISPPLPSVSAMSIVTDGWNVWNVSILCLISLFLFLIILSSLQHQQVNQRQTAAACRPWCPTNARVGGEESRLGSFNPTSSSVRWTMLVQCLRLQCGNGPIYLEDELSKLGGSLGKLVTVLRFFKI